MGGFAQKCKAVEMPINKGALRALHPKKVILAK
jgi:hypothetical protein